MADAPSPISADGGTVPQQPALEGLEAKWGEVWERDGTHRFLDSEPKRRPIRSKAVPDFDCWSRSDICE